MMSPGKPKILVVDDEPGILDIIGDILKDEGYDLYTASNGEQARQKFLTVAPDLVLLDIWMPDVDGITLLRDWLSAGALQTPVIMMSGHGSIETAVEATRLGAFDFIEKPLSLGRLLLAVKNALEVYAEKRQSQQPYSRQVSSAPAFPVGQSAAVQALQAQAKVLAKADSCILLTGEYGSGRRFWARYIHTLRGHSVDQFVVIDSLSIKQLSDIVDQMQQGTAVAVYIENAHRLPMNVLQEIAGACTGAARTDSEQSMQWVKRLMMGVPKGCFDSVKDRPGLEYFCFEALRLNVPPVRDRSEDVPDLLNSLVNRLVSEEGLPYRKLSVAALNRLRHYSWPGNMAEMKSLVRQLLLADSGQEVAVSELDELLQPADSDSANINEFLELPLREAREKFERQYLKYYLARHDGNVGRVANIIGVERTHLYRKLKALGLPMRTRKG